MSIRTAAHEDAPQLLSYDRHIAQGELLLSVSLGRIIVAEHNGQFAGWLRWNLFWDHTPFMNMLFVLDAYRNHGYGGRLVSFWEEQMKALGHGLVMTSTLSSERAQHFYRARGYVDAGSLLLKGEALEILFTKDL